MSDLISRENAIREARPEYLNLQQEKLASIEALLRTIYNQGWNDAIDEYMSGIEALPSAQQWIPLRFESEGDTNFPYELDGHWVIVTDGETISVERIKKDAYDHFFPNGRWFELEDVKAWMPLPEPYKKLFQPFCQVWSN